MFFHNVLQLPDCFYNYHGVKKFFAKKGKIL